MPLSIFDLFKIGIGPSSSHTVGPMRAARAFGETLEENGSLASAARIQVELFGSLAFTGVGHGTDRAVILGLAGEHPEAVDPDAMDAIVERVKTSATVSPAASICAYGPESGRQSPARGPIRTRRARSGASSPPIPCLTGLARCCGGSTTSPCAGRWSR